MFVPHPLPWLRHFFLMALLFLLFGTVTLPRASTAPAVPPGGPTPIRPLEYSVTVTGTHAIGDVVEFSHTLGPDPATLHPVWVYSGDGSTLWGVGKYALEFVSGALPVQFFGNGIDGDLIVAAGQTVYTDEIRTAVSTKASAGQNTVNVSSTTGIKVGDEVLIIEMMGTTAGIYEFQRVVGVSATTVSLASTLVNSYQVDALARAQVIKVNQYHNLTVHSTGMLTSHPWNGATGGVIVFKVRGTALINGEISASGIGWRGGARGEFGPPTHSQAYGGESYSGLGGPSVNANGGAGGGGNGDPGVAGNPNSNPLIPVGSGGGGGGHATTGTTGQVGAGSTPGFGGYAYGDTAVTIPLGSGGGGGGADDNVICYGGTGGNGGGSILAGIGYLTVTYIVVANGVDGTRGNPYPNDPESLGFTCRTGGGGGGSGGSIKIMTAQANLGTNLVVSNGAPGGPGTNKEGGAGGYGSQGRIRVEHCFPLTGSTFPNASTASLECHSAEQVETSPYLTTSLTLPESFTDTRSYTLHYGRRFVFQSGGEQLKTIRVPVGAWTNVTLDALLSDFESGPVTFQLDIGNDGTWEWQPGAINDATILPSINLASAFNAYWQSQGSPQSGTLAVPVRVGFSTGGQVILTNLEMIPVTPTPTPTGTNTPVPTATMTPTIGPSPTATPTTTPGPSPTATATNTPGPSASATPTPVASSSPTVTRTGTPVITNIPSTTTATPTATPTQGVVDGAVYIPLVLRHHAFATPPPATPTPNFTNTPVPTCEVLDHEPNNFFSQANANLPLCEGGIVVGSVSVNDIDDYYRLQLDHAATVRIDLTGIPIGADYDLYLYDASGGPVTVSNNSGSVNEMIRTQLASGRYYIRIYSLNYAAPNTYQVQWVRE